MSSHTTFSTAPEAITVSTLLDSRFPAGTALRDQPSSHGNFGQLFERVAAVNDRQKLAASPRRGTPDRVEVPVETQVGSAASRPEPVQAPTKQADADVRSEWDTHSKAKPNTASDQSAQAGEPGADTASDTPETSRDSRMAPDDALAQTHPLAVAEPVALGAATWLLGAGRPQLAGDLQAVPLAGGMQIIAPTQGPDAASLLAFAQAQGLSPQALKVLVGGVSPSAAADGDIATSGETLDPLVLLRAGAAGGQQSTAQLLGQIMDARALATGAQLPAVTNGTNALLVDPQTVIAQTLVVAGLTDEDLRPLLSSSKPGALDPLGLERTGLLVPRAVNPTGVALPNEPLGSTASQRSALYESISQRLVDALGARIQGQIAKGQWTMQLTLKPASLGRIDVDLRMHNGELEARFVSANPVTRDLLQDGAQRLRDNLAQAGTDIARVSVDAGASQSGHGKSTPQSSGVPLKTAMQAGDSEPDGRENAAVSENRRDDGTLNILV
ncbi:MAG: flagellar hook-length control protein FliK [Burkholderiaceae bacterium]